MASDYTRGLSLQAIKLVFENLEHSYHFGDEESREKMHNASTMAGMAFANAFLGINHSLAHKVGPMFDIPHGRTNAILMPHVILKNTLCSLNMITSVQTRITQTSLVSWDGVLINNQMLNWLKFWHKKFTNWVLPWGST